MQVDIHYHRVNKPPVTYREHLVSDDGKVLRTDSLVPEASRAEWSDRWVSLGLAAPGSVIARVRKWHHYGEWFSILELRDPTGLLLGYYCDVLTPLARLDSSVYELHDLLLDVWIDARGHLCVLDRDEFAAAIRAGQLTPELQARAETVLAQICTEHERGTFLTRYLVD